MNSTVKKELKNISFQKWSKIALSISLAISNLNIVIWGSYLSYSIAREIYLFVYTLIFANILYFILNNEFQNKTDFCFAYVRKKDINMRIGKLHLYPFFPLHNKSLLSLWIETEKYIIVHYFLWLKKSHLLKHSWNKCIECNYLPVIAVT